MPVHRVRVSTCRAQQRDLADAPPRRMMGSGSVGEDSAAFELEEQRFTSWALFFSLLTGVLVLIYAVRITALACG